VTNVTEGRKRRAAAGSGTGFYGARADPSVRSAHLNTDGRMLSQERHFGQRQNQPTLCMPQSSH